MKILVTGPQGSGKTTQAKLLAEYLAVPLIGTGDVLRALSKKNTKLGKKIKEVLDKGKLVDDVIAAGIVEERLSKSDCQGGFVTDGYPRSLHQIELLDLKFDKVFYIDISDKEVLQRLIKREREDDTPEVIAQRLRIYHEMTEPILSYFKTLGILERIDGLGEIDDIQARIREKANG